MKSESWQYIVRNRMLSGGWQDAQPPFSAKSDIGD